MTASITCPQCGRTSHHPTDIAEGYCGNCHAFTSLVLPPLPPKWGAEYQTRQVRDALAPVLSKLDLPGTLPGEMLPPRVLDVPLPGDEISRRRGTLFYGINGEPIELPPTGAMDVITATRTADSRSEIRDSVDTATGVQVIVATTYIGLDMSTPLGPLPLVWETLVLVGEGKGLLELLGDSWRYTTLNAAHAGHHQVVAAVRKVAGT